jgi:hypothetical protein
MRKVNIYILLFSVVIVTTSMAQIHSAKITFERKTNLYKKFKDQGTQRWIKEEDRIKIDYFELLVNDSMALFKPQESELREAYAWATAKNTVLQDAANQSRYMIKTIWGEELHLTDSMFKRTWKITESSRKNCRLPLPESLLAGERQYPNLRLVQLRHSALFWA